VVSFMPHLLHHRVGGPGTHHMGGLIVSGTSHLALGEKKHLLTLPGIKLSFLSCPSLSIVAVSTVLFQLLIFEGGHPVVYV